MQKASIEQDTPAHRTITQIGAEQTVKHEPAAWRQHSRVWRIFWLAADERIVATHIHVEARHEDRIAIRLGTDGVRVDALLTRETREWILRYVDPRGVQHEVDLLHRRTPWPTALRHALKYCDERLTVWTGEAQPR